MYKKLIYSFCIILLFPLIAFSAGVEVLKEKSFEQNGKQIYLITNVIKKVIIDNGDDNYMAYIVKIPNGDDVYFSGMASYCSMENNNDKVAQISTELVKYYNSDDRIRAQYLFTSNIGRYMESTKTPNYKTVTGIITPVHNYVCENYYRADMKKYYNYLELAKEYTSKQDYKLAIEQYNNAILYAENLSNNGYSSTWQAKAYLLLGDLYFDIKKFAKAKENYLKIIAINDLKNEDIKKEANKKLAELPEIKGEKAGNFFKNVGNGLLTIIAIPLAIVGGSL